jgi:hypothetical protein
MGIRREAGRAELPDINAPLAADTELILIGDRGRPGFFARYRTGRPRPAIG